MTQHIESLKVEREYDDFVVTVKLSKSAWWSIKGLVESIVQGQGTIDSDEYHENDHDFQILKEINNELEDDYGEALF